MSQQHSNHDLPNYLRTHRKRAGFSQEEIAFLLGAGTAAPISRYERFARKPTLAIVFALEIILGVSARQLFSGLRQKVEERVAKRAALLLRRALRQRDHAPLTKLQALQRMTAVKITGIKKQ